MARIRHIALVTDDPAKTAEFYKEQFGLTELYRRPGDTGEKGVWLSDGYIYFAILKYGESGAPKLGPGQTSEMRGIHHIGFYVDDEQATAKALEAANYSPVPIPKTERLERTPMGDAVNLKYMGPDDVHIDIRSRGWNEAISFAMQRYDLTPVKEGSSRIVGNRFTWEDVLMIYEVRTYTLRPGTLAEFEERYEKRLPLREKTLQIGGLLAH